MILLRSSFPMRSLQPASLLILKFGPENSCRWKVTWISIFLLAALYSLLLYSAETLDLWWMIGISSWFHLPFLWELWEVILLLRNLSFLWDLKFLRFFSPQGQRMIYSDSQWQVSLRSQCRIGTGLLRWEKSSSRRERKLSVSILSVSSLLW